VRKKIKRIFVKILLMWVIFLLGMIWDKPFAYASYLQRIPPQAWKINIKAPLPAAGKPRVSYPMIDDGPNQGLPIGGFGSGSIGRTYRGDFARWHIKPGVHIYGRLPANQFSIYWRLEGQKGRARVLNPDKASGGLKKWNRGMKDVQGCYSALYPFAWYSYKVQDLPLDIVLKEFSPVIPNNYRESSYPVGIFAWRIKNRGTKSCFFSVMFSFVNMVGWFDRYERNLPSLSNFGNINLPTNFLLKDGVWLKGILFSRQRAGGVLKEGDGSMVVAAREGKGVKVSRCLTFNAYGDGSRVWKDFTDNGVLDREGRTYASVAYIPIAGAVCATVTLSPGEEVEIPFVLTWDFPLIEFGQGRVWKRKYTDFFGDSGNNAIRLAVEALLHYPEWESEIERWQKDIMSRPGRPPWYLSMLFNELYYLVDGGTVWTSSSTDGKEHFAILECFDYPFYSTLDVWFYGSFPLILNWPRLEKRVMEDFCKAVFLADDVPVRIGASGKVARRKVRNVLPHDIGCPEEDPFVMINSYRWQDTNTWKDLNSKFVLLLWRDFFLTGAKDIELLRKSVDAMESAIQFLKRFDRNGDFLPENDGVPDQTYDTWTMKGESAYCSILWLASLEALTRMENLLDRPVQAARYFSWVKKARRAILDRLWNGRYFYYDTRGPFHECVMSDQLCGAWYARILGIGDILPSWCIKNALKEIFRVNVMGFANGTKGAVNGQFPNLKPVLGDNQAGEVWTGTNFALASTFFLYGMKAKGWKIAKGIYDTVWVRKGYWFRTPEAYDKNGNFRASMYLRPGAVWAMELALERVESESSKK